MDEKVYPSKFRTGKSRYEVAVQPDNPELVIAVSPDEIRQAIRRISQSKYFVHAPKKQKFVQLISDYYLQGRTAELSEYLIGYEVFEKGTGYNPSTDPVVRVSAHDVRKKLEQYYQNEGATDPVRMLVPVGTYVPVFVRGAEPPAAPESVAKPELAIETVTEIAAVAEPLLDTPPTATTKFKTTLGASVLALVAQLMTRTSDILLGIAGITLFLLVGALIWVVSLNRELQKKIATREFSAQMDPALVRGVWEPFLANQVSTLMVLSNPVVYRTLNGADPEVLVKKSINLTSEQANLLTNISNDRLPLRPNQPLQLIPAFNMYTGIGEAIGAYRLQGLLQSIGEASLLKQSRNVGADDLKDHDAILLGSVYANQWAKPLSIKENFVYTSRTSIENLAPLPGEQREYVSLFDQRTGTLLEDYALITVVPGVAGKTAVMSLSGIYSEGTQAAVEYVTDQAHLAELHQKLIQLTGKDAPRYFQALLKVRVENSFPTQITLLVVRGL